jgi:hypothetical protein
MVLVPRENEKSPPPDSHPAAGSCGHLFNQALPIPAARRLP